MECRGCNKASQSITGRKNAQNNKRGRCWGISIFACIINGAQHNCEGASGAGLCSRSLSSGVGARGGQVAVWRWKLRARPGGQERRTRHVAGLGSRQQEHLLLRPRLEKPSRIVGVAFQGRARGPGEEASLHHCPEKTPHNPGLLLWHEPCQPFPCTANQPTAAFPGRGRSQPGVPAEAN